MIPYNENKHKKRKTFRIQKYYKTNHINNNINIANPTLLENNTQHNFLNEQNIVHFFINHTFINTITTIIFIKNSIPSALQ